VHRKGITLDTQWSVTDFCSSDTQQVRLRCPDENDGGMKGESKVPGGP